VAADRKISTRVQLRQLKRTYNNIPRGIKRAVFKKELRRQLAA
jgi:hypothetical protein